MDAPEEKQKTKKERRTLTFVQDDLQRWFF